VAPADKFLPAGKLTTFSVLELRENLQDFNKRREKIEGTEKRKMGTLEEMGGKWMIVGGGGLRMG